MKYSVGLVVGLLMAFAPAAQATTNGWSSLANVDPLLRAVSVSCASAGACAVVSRNAASTYSGTSWTSPAVIDSANDLSTVSCGSASFCVAVDGGGPTWTFNGTTWSSGATVPGGFAPKFVSCISTSFCMSVDGNGRASMYDGMSWSAFVTFEPLSGGGQPTGVSCVSSSFCAAVDSHGNAFTYDGSSWSGASLVDSSGGLTGVSCVSSSFCAAVDSIGHTLLFDGSSWSSPRLTDTASGLTAVSCFGGSFCMAVDDQGNETVYASGRWSALTSIDPLGGGLTGVSCLASSDCVLVDAEGAAVYYSGSSSSVGSSAIGGGGLTDTSCPTVTFCTAVDWNGQALTFDGTHWSAPEAVEPAGLGLAAVSCPSPAFCAAVDESGDAVSDDGTSWSALASFDSHGGTDSVSCPSASFCVAVDQSGYAYRFSKGSWGAGTNIDGGRALLSVSCATTTFCAAVDASGYAVLFDGGAWSAPVLVDGSDGLTAVSCGSSSSCIAMGGPSIWKYDGWSWQSEYNENVTYPWESVSCPTASFCAAFDNFGYALTSDSNVWGNATIVDNVYASQDFSLTPIVACASAAFCAAVDELGNALTYSATPPPAPINTSAPTASGVAGGGYVLTEVNGGWTNSPTSYTYQWEDCNSSGANCWPIPGATRQRYSVSTADVGDTIRVQESAYNMGGIGGPISSMPTAVVQPASAPGSILPPTITGSAAIDQLLSATAGTWSHGPSSFSYQWMDCVGRSICQAISGATGSTYQITANDAEHDIEVAVTATNSRGSAQAFSAPTAVVYPPPTDPVSLTPPMVTGGANVGLRLSGSPGSWNPSNVSETYQWQRCTPTCADIPGATSRSYTLMSADLGWRLRFVATARFTSFCALPRCVTGSTRAASSEYGPIAPGVGVLGSALDPALAVHGRAARIRPLLKAGRFGLNFAAPAPGRLEILWYTPPVRHRQWVVFARASVWFHSQEAARVWVVLTRAGRRLLRGTVRPLLMKVKSAFFPYEQQTGSVVRWSKQFRLQH